jgi:hypothetical protein
VVSDQDRRELFNALERELGHTPAATLMELLPPIGWADVAHQSDLVAVRGEMAELRGEMAEVRGEMAEVRGEMAGLRAELKGEMAELRAELKGEMAEFRGEVRAEIRTQLPKLYAANVVSMFATAGLVLAAAKLA